VENRTVRVVVELELEPGEPVCGSAALEGELPVPFEGMLAFLSVFEQLQMRARPSDQPRQREP
jgi:hypothetical protein